MIFQYLFPVHASTVDHVTTAPATIFNMVTDMSTINVIVQTFWFKTAPFLQTFSNDCFLSVSTEEYASRATQLFGLRNTYVFTTGRYLQGIINFYLLSF